MRVQRPIVLWAADSAANGYLYPNASKHADAGPDLRHGHGYADTHLDQHAHSYFGAYQHTHTNRNQGAADVHTNAIAYRGRHATGGPDEHTNGYTQPYVHQHAYTGEAATDGDENPARDAPSHRRGDGYTHARGDAPAGDPGADHAGVAEQRSGRAGRFRRLAPPTIALDNILGPGSQMAADRL